MNKQELVAAIAEHAGLGPRDAARALDALIETVTASLKRGEEVRLTGFGSFVVAQRKASTTLNPRTREPMAIKASAVPKFRAGKALKEAVN